MTKATTFGLVAVMVLAGCSSVKKVSRSELMLKGDAAQTQDGLTMSARVVDLASAAKDPRLSRTIDAVVATTLGDAQQKVTWTVLMPPIFELKIANQTGHVVRMNGAVFKLIDSAGNLYDAVPKDKASAQLLQSLGSSGMKVSPAGAAELNGALQQVKLLTENTQLLPDLAETFYLAFDLPIPPTTDGYQAWMGQQSVLRLKIYEVPTRTSDAGAITKRVAFEFPVQVKTFVDTYEVGMLENKLLGTEELRK